MEHGRGKPGLRSLIEDPMTDTRTHGFMIVYQGEDFLPALRGDIGGLYGRMPGELMRLVRKIADAPNYDHAAMELLDALDIDWRKP